MKYPTLSKTKTPELAAQLLDGEAPDIDVQVEWEGDGSEVDLALVERVADEAEEAWLEKRAEVDKDRDLFEGEVARALYSAVKGMPIGTLDDPGFWRFLTLRHFWWFVTWREAKTFQDADYGKYRKYVDGVNVSECVLCRMYLRGRIAEHAGDPSLTTAIPHGTDFWRSHVFRVRTGTAPTLAGAFATEQSERRMPTDELRSYARRLNRVWTNVVLDLYEDDVAKALIHELREDAPISD